MPKYDMDDIQPFMDATEKQNIAREISRIINHHAIADYKRKRRKVAEFLRSQEIPLRHRQAAMKALFTMDDDMKDADKHALEYKALLKAAKNM